MTSFPVSRAYLFFVISLLVGYDVTTSQCSADVTLEALTSQFWHWKLREFPELATTLGYHDNDDKLESFSYSSYVERLTYCQKLLVELESINTTCLQPVDKLTYEVFKDQLSTYIEGYKWKDYGAVNPVNFLEGIHRGHNWVKYGKYETAADYDKYLKRLNAFPKQVEEVINLMERAIRSGLTNHIVSMRGVIDQISNISDVDPYLTPFYKPYGYTLDKNTRLRKFSLRIRSEGRNVIQNGVQRALRRLKMYLQSRYMRATRPEVGVYSLPNGKDYYKSLLHWHLSTDLDPEEIHQLGLREVERIKIEMEKLMRWLNYDGDLTSFLKHLKKQKRFYDHDERALLNKYKDVVYHRIQPRLPLLFSNLSVIPNITILPTTLDGIDAGYYKNVMLINTYKPHTRPDFSALTICLHEALPGHHLQISFAKRQLLPDFRRHIWPQNVFAAPFSFPYYTAYVEGWALYAEFLGEELALFDRPYELFGRYTYEIFRAGRLVVDTGIHAMGWTRSEAIEYLANYTLMSRDQIEMEVDRYITWPGQACAYKIGELKIKDLRTKAMNKLGWRYNPRDFHRSILQIAPVPLRLLEDHIDSWIARNVPSVAYSKHLDDFNFFTVLIVILFRAFMMNLNIHF